MMDDISVNSCQPAGHRSRESAPLVEPKKSNINYFYVLALLIILLLGVSTGSYLLFKEKGWSQAYHLPVNFIVLLDRSALAPLNIPAQTVNIIEANTTTKELWKEKNKYFNFQIDERGHIDEWLGWNYCCDTCDNKTVTISFILKENDRSSPEVQIQSLKMLLYDGVMTHTLQDCYYVLAPIDNIILRNIAGNLTTSRHQCQD